MSIKRSIIVLILTLKGNVLLADKAKLGENVKQQLNTIEILVDGQKKVVDIDDKTQELLREYRLTLRKIENTKLYNQQLVQLIEDQKQEKVNTAKQIEEIQVTNQEVVPLMTSMVDTLDQIIKKDTPFLKDERVKRVEELKSIMTRADVSNSEKYRRILEAYMIENEYGKTLEAYRGLLSENGTELTVDYLKVGRLAFMYQTLDGKKQGLWDVSKNDWVTLDSDYKNSIREALKIARKQSAPDLIKLPLVSNGGSL